MKFFRLAIAVGLMGCLAASQASAQVMQLGRARTTGHVAQASCCGGGSSMDSYEPAMIGGGSCGGTCGECGIGGFFGRGLTPISPCACGGSLIVDMAMGAKRIVDNTISCVFGHVFGGLQAVSCHASGTFAALQCATSMGCCGSCGMNSCDGGCGGAGEVYADSDYSSSYSSSSFGSPAYAPAPTMSVEPIPASIPQPATEANPFLDDPPTIEPQARRAPSMRGSKTSNIRPTSAVEPVANPLGGSRYYSGRSASFRR